MIRVITDEKSVGKFHHKKVIKNAAQRQKKMKITK